MLEKKAFGSFIRRNNYLYRTEAYIQWGESEQVIGTVIMLNPGSATASSNILDGQEVISELKLDPTMEQLIKIIEEGYTSYSLNGRVYIYNLFALQNSKNQNAIKQFEQLWPTGEPLICEFSRPEDEIIMRLKQSEWILIGWGCNHTSTHLIEKKRQWLRLLDQVDTPIVGRRGKGSFDFYHPRHKIPQPREVYKREIVQQLQKLLRCEKIEMQDQSWKRHIGVYEPVQVWEVNDYCLMLYDLQEDGRPVNYIYRLFIFEEGKTIPFIAFNYETSMLGTSCLGITLTEGRINVDNVPTTFTLEQFKAWVQSAIPQHVPNLNVKLVDDRMDEITHRRFVKFLENVLEYEDAYEYLLVNNYDELSIEKVDSVPIANTNVSLLEINGEYMPISWLFYKSNWTLLQAFEWSQQYEMHVMKIHNEEPIVVNGSEIVDVERFKNYLIVATLRGNNHFQLDPAIYADITKIGHQFGQFVNTLDSKKPKLSLEILLNGAKLSHFYRIEFDRLRDQIIANGYKITVDYMDLYEGVPAFYLNGIEQPIMIMADEKTTVEIELYETVTGMKTCIVEHRYVLEVPVD